MITLRHNSRPHHIGIGRPHAGGSLAAPSVAGIRLRDDVEVAVEADGPLLICGESGVGKLFVAKHVHRRRADTEQLTVLDAIASHEDSSAWLARLSSTLAGGGTVVLRHLDELVGSVVARVQYVVRFDPHAQPSTSAATSSASEAVNTRPPAAAR